MYTIAHHTVNLFRITVTPFPGVPFGTLIFFCHSEPLGQSLFTTLDHVDVIFRPLLQILFMFLFISDQVLIPFSDRTYVNVVSILKYVDYVT